MALVWKGTFIDEVSSEAAQAMRRSMSEPRMKTCSSSIFATEQEYVASLEEKAQQLKPVSRKVELSWSRKMEKMEYCPSWRRSDSCESNASTRSGASDFSKAALSRPESRATTWKSECFPCFPVSPASTCAPTSPASTCAPSSPASTCFPASPAASMCFPASPTSVRFPASPTSQSVPASPCMSASGASEKKESGPVPVGPVPSGTASLGAAPGSVPSTPARRSEGSARPETSQMPYRRAPHLSKPHRDLLKKMPFSERVALMLPMIRRNVARMHISVDVKELLQVFRSVASQHQTSCDARRTQLLSALGVLSVRALITAIIKAPDTPEWLTEGPLKDQLDRIRGMEAQD